MIQVGSLWRPKPITSTDPIPLRFNLEAAMVDSFILEPGFVILEASRQQRASGVSCWYLKILRLSTKDDPPYKGYVSFPSSNWPNWTMKYTELDVWNHYFERWG